MSDDMGTPGLMAMLALLILGMGFAFPSMLGMDPILTFEETIVLMVLNIGTLIGDT